MIEPGKVLARYTSDDGDELTLTASVIRDVIATSPSVTDREVYLFAALCKAQKLNPFIREAHLVKYGDRPATMVVGKDVFVKRAQANPRFRGMRAGVFVIDANGRGKEREGSMVLDGEAVVGGWAKVYVEGYEHPVYDSVSFDEYAGRKKDGSLNQTWAGKPGTMIRKVALVHALREAFPTNFTGLYDSSEMGIEEPAEEPAAEPVRARVESAEPAEAVPEIVEEGPPIEAYGGFAEGGFQEREEF